MELKKEHGTGLLFPAVIDTSGLNPVPNEPLPGRVRDFSKLSSFFLSFSLEAKSMTARVQVIYVT